MGSDEELARKIVEELIDSMGGILEKYSTKTDAGTLPISLSMATYASISMISNALYDQSIVKKSKHALKLDLITSFMEAMYKLLGNEMEEETKETFKITL